MPRCRPQVCISRLRIFVEEGQRERGGCWVAGKGERGGGGGAGKGEGVGA
jgi:hypothetical protein